MINQLQENTAIHKMIPLLASAHQKPIDLGNGRLSISIKPDGRVCSINRPHRKHGFITLTSMEQFPNDKWYDSSFVRGYRKEIAEGKFGFGVVPQSWTDKPEVYLLESKYPIFHYRFDQHEVYSAFFVEKIEKVDVLIQQLELVNSKDEELVIPVEIGGQLSLNRSSYGQLTEGGPIPIPSVVNNISISGNQIVIQNSNLGARAEISIFDNKQPLNLETISKAMTETVELSQVIELKLQPNEKKIITAVYALNEDENSRLIGEGIQHSIKHDINGKKELMSSEDWNEFIINRNIEYIVSCCAVPIHDESICIITDHQLLPLAWNRDAYYMMQLLFGSLQFRRDEGWTQKVQELIKGHLIWMFEDAQRPDGYWGRAYLTNGYSKDQIFQLDQQCYPVLELCNYYQEFQDKATVKRVLPIVKEILEMLIHHKAENHWLFKTAETPADDEVEYPYHFSSQVLMWHMLTELDKLNKELNLLEEDFGEMAEKVRRDCLAHFTYKKNGQELFAYLTDLKGGYQLYHDANDLPTVLAPLWGFCHETDSTWLETMKFAFSTENKGGYYAGAFEGLGSVHTPHKWPLGDGQELIFALLINNKEKEEYVASKLKKAVQWDGLFSEAVDETSGEVASRHWFSWPGAFISYVLLLLEKRNK